MKLTKVNKDADFNVFLDDHNEGFILGREAKTIPYKYSDIDYKKEMRHAYAHEFARVIDRTNIASLKDMKPCYAHVTDAGTLIIE